MGVELGIQWEVGIQTIFGNFNFKGNCIGGISWEFIKMYVNDLRISTWISRFASYHQDAQS
jgi:hypothetical protein